MFHASAKKCEGQSFSIQRQPGLLPVSGYCGQSHAGGPRFLLCRRGLPPGRCRRDPALCRLAREYSSDLFEIDDLNAFADAFGVERPDPHVHDLAWTLSPMDDGTSRYANVNVVFRCGCTLSKQNIKKFANDMRRQMGWNVATSTVPGCHGSADGSEVYTIRVERRTLGHAAP